MQSKNSDTRSQTMAQIRARKRHLLHRRRDEAARLAMNLNLHPSRMELSAWDPLDQFMLFWWVLVEPERFIVYKHWFGKRAAVRVCSWIISTLTWLPLIIPVAGVALGRLPIPPEYTSASRFVLLGMVMIWVLTGVTALLSDGIALGTAFALAFVIVSTATFLTAFGELGSTVGILAMGSATITALVAAVGVVAVVHDNLESGYSSLPGIVVFAAMVFSYTSLTWMYMLGGWWVLVNLQVP